MMKVVKVVKDIILVLFLGLTLAFTGFANEVDLSQGGKGRETPKEKKKDQSKDKDRGKRDDDRKDRDKKDKRKKND
jgi:hypothetical protein